MECKSARKMLVDYINQVLSPEKSLLLQGHLASCNSCRQELETMKKVLGLINSVKVEYPPDHVWNNFQSDLHQRIESEAVLAFRKQQRQRLYFLPGWAASIAAIVMIIFTSVILTYHPSSSSIKLSDSKKIDAMAYKSKNTREYGSEPKLVANVISDVLITETQAAEIKKLVDFQQSENPYYYEYTLNDVLVELGNTKESEGLIRSLLNDEFTLFDDNQSLEFSNDEYGSM
jgi:hypothetical protein